MEPDNMIPAEQIPAELWMSIFELMDAPGDLSSVVRSCRRFHNYGVRALHRNVVWRSPEQFTNNAPIWAANPGIALSVSSLELGISTLPSDVTAWFVDEVGHVSLYEIPEPPLPHPDEEIVDWPDMIADEDAVEILQGHATSALMKSIDYYKMHHSYATVGLYQAVMNRVMSFTNIKNLSLRHLIFTDQLFGVLYQLPQLSKLHVEFCLFPSRQSITERDPFTLPITDLSLLNLRRQVLRGGDHIHEGHHPFADMDDDVDHVLSLALAHNLRTLRVDSTADVFANVYRKRLGGVYVYTIPGQLQHLYVQRKQAVEGVVQPVYNTEQLYPGAVYSIMERCPTLTTISLAYPLPKHSTFPKPDALPNLTRCEGVLEAVMALTTGRPLEAISILRSDTPTEGILEMLARKANEHPGLQMLSLHCKTWDLEILDAICQLFPELRKLKITFDLREPGKMWEHRDYWSGVQPFEMFDALEEARTHPEFIHGSKGPDEDTVVSFGPHFLYRLEHLHTAHIYALPINQKPDHPPYVFDHTFGSVEEELRNLVIPWNRFCKNLRDVQLHVGYAMRRDYDGGVWRIQTIKDIRDGSDFNF